MSTDSVLASKTASCHSCCGQHAVQRLSTSKPPIHSGCKLSAFLCMSLAARRLCWSVVTCSGRLLKHQPRHPKPLRQLWSSRYSVSLQAPLAMGSPDADRAKAKAVLGTTLPQLEEDLADWLVDDVLDSAAWSGPPEVLQVRWGAL